MTDLSENIKCSLENVIQVYEAVASLFGDSDELMKEEGFQCRLGNSIGTEQSKSLLRPARWLTPYASRYYDSHSKSEKRGICIQMLDLDTEKPIKPIVLMGSFWQSKKGKPNLPYSALWEAWSLVKDEHEQDKGKDIPFFGLRDIFYGKIRAIDLASVKTQAALKRNVIKPLIDMDPPARK